MNAKELSNRLSSDAARVAQYLLPNGKKVGAEWRAGSTGGDEGQSLGVHLTGGKAGVWCDFSTGESGDLLDLWMTVRSCNLVAAMEEAAEFMGVSQDFAAIVPQKKTFKPASKPNVLTPKTGSAVHHWLTVERCLSEAALRAYKVGASTGEGATKHLDPDTYAVFPFMRGGKLINWKARHITDKKKMLVAAGAEPLLFGWQAIPENARTVVICEGEIDALTLWDYGWPALSVQSGAGNHAWVDTDFHNLDRFSEIYLCLDNDEAGQKGTEELAERLGRDRCKVVRLPKKDANECRMAHVDKAKIDEAFANAKTNDPSVLKNASHYRGEVLSEFYPADDENLGVILPWPKVGHKFAMRPAEYSVWFGYSGHGKSQMLGQVMLAAMSHGHRVCIASLEMRPRKVLWRLIRQMTGEALPRKDQIDQCIDWLTDRLWIFDLVGTAKVDAVLDVWSYAHRRYGIEHFILDSFMKLDVREENDPQREAVAKICDFKNSTNSHVHLVAHARKGADENTPPNKQSVRGAAAITDMADNVVGVWRNKPKEASGGTQEDKGDAYIEILKQRNGDWEGAVALWYDKASFQYRGNADDPVMGMRVFVGPVVDRTTATSDAMVDF